MIGREKRVLLRHYLEQGMNKAVIARDLGVSRRWLETEANVRSHATLKERPLDRFERERLLLEPLATRPYHPLVLPPDRSSPGTTSLPAIHVERRPLTAYAQIAGGDR